MRRLVILLMFAAFFASAQNTQDSTTRHSTHLIETRLQIGPGDSDPEYVMINLKVETKKD